MHPRLAPRRLGVDAHLSPSTPSFTRDTRTLRAPSQPCGGLPITSPKPAWALGSLPLTDHVFRSPHWSAWNRTWGLLKRAVPTPLLELPGVAASSALARSELRAWPARPGDPDRGG